MTRTEEQTLTNSQTRSTSFSNRAGLRERIDRELEEIKRYEDFTTTDWVQDAIKERWRVSAFYRQQDNSWRSYIRKSYEAGQAWIVVSIVGTLIGINSAIIAIITEWLSDIKLGYCSTGWWLNQKFCCWGVEEEDGSCLDWTDWSSAFNMPRGVTIVNWLFYVIFSILFATTCAHLVRIFAPYAAGSGISEIKCILAGFVMKGFLGGWTLLMKSIGLALSVASGLSIGKEGPSVHMACCVGNVVSRMFGKYKRNKAKTREIIAASSAAGVAVAFGSPIGGVLFSLEEMCSNFPMKTMWRSFYCALVATFVLEAMNPFRTGKLVMFQVSYNRDWHWFEVVFFVLLGVFGGIYGALMIKYNLKVVAFRKKYLKDYPVMEAGALAGITALIGYFNVFLRIDMTEIMGILFRECEGNEDYYGLCVATEARRIVALLFLAMVLRTLGTIVSYGAKVPAGIFVPSMAIGATFGRMVGVIVKAWQQAYPDFFLFASCKLAKDVTCITPGTYAFLGAAAALGGVMRITISVVVIMFELTGALNYILPTMITLMVTKAVGDWFSKGGIADRYIQLNGYPFLDKEEHTFGVPVSHVMQRDLVVLSATGQRLDEIDVILHETAYQGFPVVQDKKSMVLLGFIGRSELKYAIDKAKRVRGVSNSAHCFFTTEEFPNSLADLEENGESTSNFIDFGPYIDQTPIAVHPRLPLETVMELFKKMGPRVILIEHAGRLVGLVTVKDVLKYIARKEHSPQLYEQLAGDDLRFGGGWSAISPGRGGDAIFNRYDSDRHPSRRHSSHIQPHQRSFSLSERQRSAEHGRRSVPFSLDDLEMNRR
ncbi:uncharacterized protein VTP21DRAFT_4956 [Calcarisporiella thermophila]|uniref:uncharacterized protein n=1 Tax=Calcarisporiella thermophila TaxID=911321 RepID=UPI00374379D6